MSARTEIVEQLYTGKGTLALSRHEGIEASKKLEEARTNYEEARKEYLRYQLAMYYRVVFFGSARLPKGSEEFIFISELAKSLVEARDVDIVTGGGPGIMAAAHIGANLARKEVNRKGKKLRSQNHSLPIDLPTPEPPNSNVHFRFGRRHHEFSLRLQDFLDRTQAAYIAPGGIGTLLELVLCVQSRQVSHIENDYPIIAHPYWKPIADAWNDEMYHKRVAKGRIPLISEQDLTLILFTNKIPKVVEVISNSYDKWRTNIRDRVA